MLIQMDLPFTLEDCGGMDAVYVDQAPLNSSFFFCCKTPLGIKALDGEFCKRIMACQDEKDYLQIRHDIIYNPHLHWVIKYNLLANLERVKQETC